MEAAEYGRDRRYQKQQPQQDEQIHAMSRGVVKAVMATAAGGSMLVLAGLMLAVTVIGLAVATPLLVIFSPVLVPAAIAVALLAAGLVASGGFGLAALSVLAWMYKYLTGKNPPGADQIEQARHRLAAKARDVKESAHQRMDQATH